MFSIQLQNGESLDLYKQDISWVWSNVRFSDALKDSYSTDIEIPKTNNNCRLLGISGLLDSSSQLFGDRFAPCVLTVNSIVLPVYLEIVSVTNKSINVCVYERILDKDIKSRNINEFFGDTQSTIYEWNENSLSYYPSTFLRYGYGMAYNTNYAQYHPSRQLNLLIASMNSQLSQNLPLPYNGLDLNVVATNKFVCPQNRIQVLEMNDTSMDEDMFNIHGGQHISNDMSFGGNETKMTFNRMTYTHMKIWVCWRKKTGTTQNKECLVLVNNQNWWHLPIPSGSTDTGCEIFELNRSFNAGESISFKCSDTNRLEYVSVVVRFNHTYYGITSDDYGNELEYVSRLPRLRVAGTIDTYLPMDGNNHAVHHKNGSLTQFQTERLSFSYFGYWCNVPELTISELYNGICWLNRRKISNDDGVMVFALPDETVVLENAVITEMTPISDKFGQKNHVVYSGEEPNSSNTVSLIDNEWIEDDHVFHESPFALSHEYPDNDMYDLNIPQYANPQYDSENDTYSCDYNEIDGLAVGIKVGNHLHPVHVTSMNLDEITQIMQVTIETTDFYSGSDYVYLDGRKFMVVEGDTDLNTKETTLTALLVPGKENEDKSKPTTQAIWQLESEEVTNISCVTDQYGNTGMADVTRTATYVDINELSPTYNQTRTVDETVRVQDQTNCPVNTDPIWQNEGETMTSYECLTDDYGNTGQCVKTYTTTYRDVNPRSATHGQTRTETRTETVTDTTLCPINGPRTEYFTIKNLSNSTNTITLTSLDDSGYATTSVDVSTDGGTTWNSYRSSQNGTTIATLAKGKSLIMRHTGAMAPNGNENCIDGSGDYEVSGNIASLIHGNNFNTGSTLTMPSHAFFGLFKNSTHLKSANKLYFGAYSVVSSSSMFEMFYGCTNLVSPPNFGSITRVNGTGMYQMFMGCTSLSTCPDLSNITRVEERGMYQMFRSCTSITASPDLSGISIIGNRSMYGMFGGCTSLITPPDLSGITNVYEYSMEGMFSQCRSLTSGPDLSNVENVQTHGMDSMFYNCTSLVTPPLFENITSVDERGMYDMFKNCTSLVSGPYISSITSLGSEGMKYLFNGCSVLTTAYAPAITWDTSKTENWMQGVPETHDGMLYAKSSMIDTITWGASGIPSQWRKTAI